MNRSELQRRQNELLANIDAVTEQLTKYPNVVAVGIGLKEVGGSVTDELCYVAHVSKKLPLEELASEETIPADVVGVAIDVKERKQRVRTGDTLTGGINLTNAKKAPLNSNGTLGCMATHGDDIVLLSNHHVLYANGSTTDDPAYLKACCCCGCHKVGMITNGYDEKNSSGWNTIDAAIATKIADVTWNNDIKQIGAVQGVEEPVCGETVRKYGNRTHFTQGTITDLVNVVTLDGTKYYDIEACATKEYDVFNNKGDSGSVMVNENECVVGLLYAGTNIEGDEHNVKDPAYANDIRYVVKRLGITIPVEESNTAMLVAAHEDYDSNPLLKQYEQELSKSARGREILETIKKYRDAVTDLVNTNRQVLVTWHRNQGPGFVEANKEVGNQPDMSFVKEVEGVKIQQLIGNMAQVLEATGGESIAAAVKQWAPDAILLADVAESVNQLIKTVNTSFLPEINEALHSFVLSVNHDLPTVVTHDDFDLFGKKDNHLDPLDFNGQATAKSGGDYCLPRYCHKILGHEVCFPPFKICAEAHASAGITRLTGMKSLRISSLDVSHVGEINGGVASITGTLSLSASNIAGDGFAKASGGPKGFAPSISVSASLGLDDVKADGSITALIDIEAKHVVSIMLDTFDFSYSKIDLHIGHLGAFNKLLDPLANDLLKVVKRFFDVDGTVAGAIKQAVQQALDQAV